MLLCVICLLFTKSVSYKNCLLSKFEVTECAFANWYEVLSVFCLLNSEICCILYLKYSADLCVNPFIFQVVASYSFCPSSLVLAFNKALCVKRLFYRHLQGTVLLFFCCFWSVLRANTVTNLLSQWRTNDKDVYWPKWQRMCRRAKRWRIIVFPA